MGASQSTNGADSAGNGGEVKTSYYELLGIERTATQDDIKKAYRKRALELHPDRNYGDVERATALFAEVQSAYQVLSDDNERAWYDAHEGDILRGGDGGGEQHYEGNMRVTTSDDIARMMGKFRGNIDFSDSPNGFFGFVRETFEQLAREEAYAADYADVRIPDYPTFGHKDDAYDDVVRNFYAMWTGFSTTKSFAWLDVYRLSDAPDRRTRRLMEKENKKFREDGIRDFNEAVRTLVAFVRKRDPRYTPNRQTDEDKAKAQRDARKAQAARSRAAHAAKLEQEQEELPSWATARPEDEEEEESEEEIEEEHFECVACHKTFKSERQWEAHEKSKKHQKAVQALKRKMQKDNAHLNLDEDSLSTGVVIPVEEDGSPYHTESPIEDQDDASDDLADKIKHVKLGDADSEDDSDSLGAHEPGSKKKKKPNHQAIPKTSTEEDDDDSEDNDDEYASREEIEARLAGFRRSASQGDAKPANDDAHQSDKEPTPAPKLGKAAQKRAKRAAKQAELDESDNKHKCQECSETFPSKTQLFNHLRDEGHASLKTPAQGGGGNKKKGKKK